MGAVATLRVATVPARVHAADLSLSVVELQAENARLRQQIDTLRRGAGGSASAAAGTPSTASSPIDLAALQSAPADQSANGPGAIGDRVVVTARNRQEFAQDVPLPIQVLSGAQLERDGVTSVWDLPGKAPNLQLNPPGENARKVSISLRGIGRNGANDSAEGSVGAIVDGVALYYAGQAWTDYVHLDRIEVLRGPQGTLIGRNSTLGAINIVTMAPSFTPSQSFSIEGGSLNDIAGRFSATGPLIDGQLAYRATLVVDRANGLYTNTYQSFGKSKETWNETNKVAGRFQLLWTPSADFSARLIGGKLRSDERVNLGLQWDNGPAKWADGVARAVTTPAAAYSGGTYANYGCLGKFTQRSGWFHNADNSVYQRAWA
jgi:iron complex outermembrane receptor protein